MNIPNPSKNLPPSFNFFSLLEKYHLLFLILLLAFAFFIRVYDLAGDPPGMYMDEVSSAYNAYSILQTGKDEHGKAFPIFFEAFGEYRQGLYIYSMIPSLLVFGLTDFGTRFTSVLFGIGCILVLYFLGRRFFTKEIGLLAACLLAIQPWHFLLSRVAFEGISFVFLFLLGLLFFFKGKEGKNAWIFVSALVFALSTYSYGVAKLFVPVFLFGLFCIYRSSFFSIEKRKTFFVFIFLFLLFSLPLYYISFFGEGNSRFEEGSVFSLSEHPIFTLLLNYISHYTPSFLFFEGDADLRHHLAHYGVLYPIEIIFVLLGLCWCFQNRREKYVQMLLLWFFLFPAAASFMAGDTPHILRTFIGAPLFAMLSALGIFFLWECIAARHASLSFSFLQKKSLHTLFLLFFVVVVFAYALSAGFFLHEFFTSYKTYSSDYWLSYAEPLIKYVQEHHFEYDHVYFSSVGFGRFGVYILYHTQADPQQYLDQGLESFGYQFCNMDTNESCINDTEYNLYIFRSAETPTINGTYNIYYPDNKTIAVKLFAGGNRNSSSSDT